MMFGQVLEALYRGKRTARKGWNSKGMFLFCTPGEEISISQLRSDIARYTLQSAGKSAIKLQPHIDMKMADDSIMVGWTASQADLLANDWMIID